jgi:hypothetical protein
MHVTGQQTRVASMLAEIHCDLVDASVVANYIWGRAPNAIWAVGDHGKAFYYDGTRWSATQTGDDASLTDVWASSPSDVWAVGTITGSASSARAPYHYDGASWSRVDGLSGAETIWGADATHVWVARSDGGILRYQP